MAIVTGLVTTSYSKMGLFCWIRDFL